MSSIFAVRQLEASFECSVTFALIIVPCLLTSFSLCLPGEASAVLAKAEAKAKAIRLLSDALTRQVRYRTKLTLFKTKKSVHCDLLLFCEYTCCVWLQNGNAAASLSIAEQYVAAFSNLAKESNTILLPSNTGDISSMVTQVGVTHHKAEHNSAFKGQ